MLRLVTTEVILKPDKEKNKIKNENKNSTGFGNNNNDKENNLKIVAAISWSVADHPGSRI